MRALKIFLIVVLALAGLFLVVAFFLPQKRTMQSEIQIEAPAEVVFDLVNSFQNWPAWSPFHANDTSMVVTYQGPVSGTGAQNTWTGKMGTGSQLITQSADNDSIIIDLMFMEDGTPWKETWMFDAQGSSTNVTWKVETNELSYPLGRYFGIMLPSLMNSVFTQGLENLKEVSEGIKKDEDAGLMSEIKRVNIEEQPVISITDTIMVASIGQRMGSIYGELSMYAEMAGAEIIGKPYAIFHENLSEDVVVLEAGYPVNKHVNNNGKILSSTLPGGKALTLSQFGPYESTHGHDAVAAYVSENNLNIKGSPREVYVNDPSTEPDTNKWETRLVYLLQ